jgi:hypothetical protein
MKPPTEIYVKLIVGFPRDPKVRALARYGTDAGLCRDLYVQMVLHCKEHLTDGFVPAEEAWALAFPLPTDHADQLAKQLASVGLIKEVSNPEAPGWQVCAFLKRNRSREQVEALSEVRAESGRAGGKASRKPPKRAGQRRPQPKPEQLGYQLDGELPPKEQRTENTGAPDGAPVPPTAGDASAPPTAQTILAAFIDWDREQGGQLTKRTTGQIAKQIAELLEQGVHERNIRQGLANWRASDQNPSTLDSFVNAVMKGGTSTVNGRPAIGRPPTTDTRVQVGLDLAARYAEAEQRGLPA